MAYTVKKLSEIAKISKRTLRYYDQIGLLKPSYISDSGYRMYEGDKIDVLQQIMFYRELGMGLHEIGGAINSSGFNHVLALEKHLLALKDEKSRIELLITNIEKTIGCKKGELSMSDEEKFEGFKKQIVSENEEKYGKELRQKYGDDVIDSSNAKMMGFTEEEYKKMKDIESEILKSLEAAVKTGENPKGEEGRRIALLHKEWLLFSWDKYSSKAHEGLVYMYVSDERFKAYYDKNVAGCAEFLKDAVLAWLGE
ncbi:MAG: MerR family transcriptional regulator [Lachnospiraceae bacterium]|nr:MerR family transcriptional regulator [Lachnospiraceae bacterium]